MILSIQEKLEFLHINSTYPILKKLLLFLLCGVMFFCILHVYAVTISTVEYARNEKLKIHDDGGFAEIFQYLQFLTAAGILLFLLKVERNYIYGIWSLFLITLFADDAFRFHEVAGEAFADAFEISSAFGLRAQDFGELAVAGFLGLFFAGPIIYSLFAKDIEAKFVSIHYIILVAVLLFFGIGIDMLHSFLNHIPGSGVFSIIEDGGEMVAGSLLLWYTVYLYFKHKDSTYISDHLPEA